MRSLGKLFVAVAALALLATGPGWAQDRTDIPDTAASSFTAPPHVEGNFLVQDVIQLNLAGGTNVLSAAGAHFKFAFTPAMTEVTAVFTVDQEPDIVVRKGGAGASGKLKSSNQAGIGILHSGGAPGSTVNVGVPAADGCKSKVKGLNLNTGSGQYLAANGVSSCTEAALTQLVPNAAARARILEMLGAPAGQGLKTISVNIPHS